MPSYTDLEREYKALSTKISYAAFNDDEVSFADHERFALLSRMLVEMSAPDFSDAKALFEAA